VFREAKYTAVLGYQRKDVQAVIDQLAAGTSNWYLYRMWDAVC
jgi:hypothetical protein